MSSEQSREARTIRSCLICVERAEQAAMAVLDEAAELRCIIGGNSSRDKRKSKEWENVHYRSVSGRVKTEAARQFGAIMDEALLTPSSVVAAMVYLTIGKPEFAEPRALQFVRHLGRRADEDTAA